jgi:hypothetical protein
MGGPGSGRRPSIESKNWQKKAKSGKHTIQDLIKVGIRKSPGKMEHRGFNIK